ncbi:MAG: hypothetical protein Q9M94_05590, partial [Candidatus Gracilibacteria bacterium]|nr:hypothetical protein [Candidatus Gracilibacteria bacterium]
TSGTYDDICFENDPMGDGIDDGVCQGNDLDDVDCDTGCAIIKCNTTNDFCSGDKMYYDFEKLFEDYKIDLIYNKKETYKENLSYVLCPQGAIGKAIETDYTTFNPSFSLYNKSMLLYKFHSNP